MWDMHEHDTGELHCPRERAPTPMPTGPYRDKRRGLVLWVANKANRFSLKTMTIHYATNYLDRVMPLLGPNISPQKFHEVAAACMLIAAKFEERPDMVPFISEVVQGEMEWDLQAGEIAQFEIVILKLLDWRLHCTTHLHFLDWHKSTGVIAGGDSMDALPILEKVRIKLMKYVYFFADMLLLDSDFCAYPKKLSSAAIIATARLTQHVEPIWSEHLANKTGFSADDITTCVNHMVHAFCRDWPDAAPDHLRNADRSPRTVTITVPSPCEVLDNAEKSSATMRDDQGDAIIEDAAQPSGAGRCAPFEEGDSIVSSAATEDGDNSYLMS